MNRRDFLRLTAAIATTPLAAKIIPISPRILAVPTKSMRVLAPWSVYHWSLSAIQDVEYQYIIGDPSPFPRLARINTHMDWSMYVEEPDTLPRLDDDIILKNFIDRGVKIQLPEELWSSSKFKIIRHELEAEKGMSIRAHYRAIELSR